MKTYTENETQTTSKAVANNSPEIRTVPLKTPALQTQLKIGKPNDEYEQEADRVADRVMSMPETAIQQQPIEEEEEMLQPKIQMQEEEEEEMMPKLQMRPIEEEEMLQTKPLLQLQPIEEEEEMLQPKRILKQSCESCGEEELPDAQRSRLGIQTSPLNHIESCGGQSLPDSSRNFFEPRFGRSFTSVKIHTCDSAVQMNQKLGAQAFTYGNNIFFNKGKYSPGSSEGKKLLAHELTHVVQQNGGLSSKIISPWIQRANTPDGVNLGPTDRSKAFCTKQTLWATTGTDVNNASSAKGLQTITFKGKNTGNSDDNKTCDTSCGLYRHWVRGYWKIGTTGAKRHDVGSCGNTLNLSETDWTEEHTSCIGDNNADASEWSYSDAPGLTGLTNGTYYELHYDFKYQLWDSCNNRSVAQARRTLDISGDTHPRTITWSTP